MIHALIPHSVHDSLRPFDRQVVWVREEPGLMVRAAWHNDSQLWFEVDWDKPLKYQERISYWFEPVSKEYIRKVIKDADNNDQLIEFQ